MISKNIRNSTALFILLFSCMFTGQAIAAAYLCPKVPLRSRKPVKWTDNVVTFRVENSIWNNAHRKSALEEAVSFWNDTAKNNFTITILQENGSSMASTNGVNEIYMANNATFSTPFALAEAPVRWGGSNFLSGRCYFNEADIKFNTAYTWDNVPEWGDFADPINMNLVALHELGHTLGQGHDNTEMATMNELYPAGGHFGSNYQSRPHGADTTLHRALYGTGSSTTDMGASAWTVVPPPGQTFQGQAYNIELIRDDYSTLANGTVTRGENVFFRYSIANLGTATGDLEVKFYMSNDQIIGDSGDIYLGMSYYTLPGGTNLTGEKYLQIPYSRSGLQYFGYKVTQASGESSQDLQNNSVRLFRHHWIN